MASKLKTSSVVILIASSIVSLTFIKYASSIKGGYNEFVKISLLIVWSPDTFSFLDNTLSVKVSTISTVYGIVKLVGSISTLNSH